MSQSNFDVIVTWIEQCRGKLQQRLSAVKIFFASWTGRVPREIKRLRGPDGSCTGYELNAADEMVDANGDRLWRVRLPPCSSPSLLLLLIRLTPGDPQHGRDPALAPR